MNLINLEKFGFMMAAHFPGIRTGEIQNLRCELCEDLKNRRCLGFGLKGQQVIACMIEKAEHAEFQSAVPCGSAMH
jgi:hypothetical protein